MTKMTEKRLEQLVTTGQVELEHREGMFVQLFDSRTGRLYTARLVGGR